MERPVSSQIPSLKTPAFVQQVRWVLDPVAYLRDCFKEDTRVIRTRFSPAFHDEVILTDHPQIVAACENSRCVSAPGELNSLVSQILGPHSLLLQSGQEHRRRRKLLSPPFHGERLRSYGSDIASITIEAMNELSDGQVFSAREMMQAISLRVILRVVFGLRTGRFYEALERLLAEKSDLRAGFLGALTLFSPLMRSDLGEWSPGGKISRNDAQTRALLADLISMKRQALADGDEADDVLSLLIMATDENGMGLDDEEIQDELLTLLFAGHETTATALSWALYWICHLPDVQQRLQAELEFIDEVSDINAIGRCRYLDAVCRETLRIHPVAMLQFPRRVEAEMVVKDVHFKPGDIILGSILGIHHRKDIYRDPDRFIPDRFLEKEFSPTEFMPFGGGARRCIGDALALFEMKLVLTSILQHWSLVKEDRRPMSARRRGITLAPSRPVMLRCRRKHISA